VRPIDSLSPILCMTMSETSLSGKQIEFISEPSPVNMADDWFEIATPEHFWIRRRFNVVKCLLHGLSLQEWRVAEVGCGHGLVQQQFEQEFGAAVDGIELNLGSLRQNVSTRGRLLHYDICERRPEFGGQYDLVVLFDVLEHIEKEAQFLEAIKFLAKDHGHLLINVPAIQNLYSEYDRCAGHLRRYALPNLIRLLRSQDLEILAATYWGLALLPFLWVRKRRLRYVPPEKVIRTGFDPGSKLVNQAMYWLSQAEPIPQTLSGTSAMVLARKVST
jgi:2-polyprenyl-3-methyl-5-hydroxy-6-metoxy-1,4-benzoquinol methylase